MLEAVKRSLHYQYRCLRLGRAFLSKRFIHCNLQVTYRCNFKCRICDFWKTDHDPADELSLGDVRVIGRKLNQLGTLIVSLAGVEPLIQLNRELGVTYMVNLYSWMRGSKDRRLPAGDVTARLLELKAKYPEFISLTSYVEQFDRAIAEGGIGDCQAGRLLLNIDHRGQVARCTETLDEPVGNILTDDAFAIRDRLAARQAETDCAQCWTSCRGFAECMFKPPRRRQLMEFFRSVRPH